MNQQKLASLACKILAIYLTIQGINMMGNVLSIYFTTPNQLNSMSLVSIIFSFILLVISGVILWFTSDWLSGIMVKSKGNDNIASEVKADDIQRILFSVLGLYFLGSAVPKVISALGNIYVMSTMPNSSLRILLSSAGVIAQLIIGLGIFFGAQNLVNFLNALRTVGVNRKEDTYEDD